jgi:hypothetical protein
VGKSVELARGTHVPARQSITVSEAADNWYRACEARQLRRVTLEGYAGDKKKIVSCLGGTKLNHLTTKMVLDFRDKIATEDWKDDEGRVWRASYKEAKRLFKTLGAILSNAKVRGLVGQNVVRDVKEEEKGKGDGRKVSQKRKLVVGIDYPTPDEVRRILAQLKGVLDLVFPNSRGGVLDEDTINEALKKVQWKAGVVNAHGEPKYTAHKLRHFFASWCINSKADGGLGMAHEPKRIQQWLGHSSIRLTFETYGHLFPRSDASAELAAADAAFFGKPGPKPATVTELKPRSATMPVEEEAMPLPMSVIQIEPHNEVVLVEDVPQLMPAPVTQLEPISETMPVENVLPSAPVAKPKPISATVTLRSCRPHRRSAGTKLIANLSLAPFERPTSFNAFPSFHLEFGSRARGPASHAARARPPRVNGPVGAASGAPARPLRPRVGS